MGSYLDEESEGLHQWSKRRGPSSLIPTSSLSLSLLTSYRIVVDERVDVGSKHPASHRVLMEGITLGDVLCWAGQFSKSWFSFVSRVGLHIGVVVKAT